MKRYISGLLLCSIAAAAEADIQFPARLADAAFEQTKRLVIYDGSYRKIPYPGGDVPAHLGVCTDVVIRAYRRLGIDLQKEVHGDMRAHFALYPKKWGLRQPDTHIDHRRVPNLQVFFKRHGVSLAVSQNATAYKPGDLVTWRLDNGLPHIGVVARQLSADGKRPLIVHNIGWGVQREDMLFRYKITGHYRYSGQASP